ncbi:tRNA (5-methylaminomethyl-2-thiouridine)(34)-methyltransferase MnmD [Flammeovirga kamogawensis]|uniref:tRNA (5-methylaminomethyl-2-thiouridine)(34)-methyltransferase MnmD n=1 Tax=Flammeovirga kamogawensis TaxID=373891 RepID=A0ABX8GRM6_9BACT|nr:tRNA (5-methylaminomethyl-2-thiouridine)(34)-methyltransferase MnmD [Flammeovirga kamogawensis]MBB6461332.1 tRNA U34 5-methylaminomethyl-2-thiouridine-forming methyltransferase MnmC [Flammeovirga kamogawensis]QWG06238.1 tRNA (5-methylaminomethyl-2-thiouridine)(34)-methyltransferase MnmD [Flammeovirga kamogawensis]TRX68069.1 tRNA (5-methylaminomethyl-2-thiouridine)(34)-methyltransferase MnmD [Flammeovirga kamogawensis]
MAKIKVIETGDGSSSLYNEALNETYHSSHGALTESRYVFVQSGWDAIREAKKEVTILEVGMGTGLNVILMVEQALKYPDVTIKMTTLEPYPLTAGLLQELNYTALLTDELTPYFEQIHSCNWEEEVAILPNFILTKKKETLETFIAPKNRGFDVIFFDAFAPNKQPEVWSVENLEKCFAATIDQGIFVTYCAKGQLRRDLVSVGYDVERYPGPPGKREMLRGWKK